MEWEQSWGVRVTIIIGGNLVGTSEVRGGGLVGGLASSLDIRVVARLPCRGLLVRRLRGESRLRRGFVRSVLRCGRRRLLSLRRVVDSPMLARPVRLRGRVLWRPARLPRGLRSFARWRGDSRDRLSRGGYLRAGVVPSGTFLSEIRHRADSMELRRRFRSGIAAGSRARYRP